MNIKHLPKLFDINAETPYGTQWLKDVLGSWSPHPHRQFLVHFSQPLGSLRVHFIYTTSDDKTDSRFFKQIK